MDDTTILPKTDPKSPFHSRIPNHSQPTEIISKRFELWRKVIKSLVVYYKTIVISNNQFSIINSNIANSFDFTFFTNLKDVNSTNAANLAASAAGTTSSSTHVPIGSQSPYSFQSTNNTKILKPSGAVEAVDPAPEDIKKQSFFTPFGNGSIQDVQILLKKYHLNLSSHQRTIALELQNIIIPRLDELTKDLTNKVKEIKELNNDFKHTINKDIAVTGQFLNDYINAIKDLQAGKELDLDPYLLRLRLEVQIKRQLYQENYLEQAYINLQNTSLELEKIVFKEIQDSLNNYSELISQEIFVHYNDLINELHEGIISKKSYFEWDEFIKRDNGKNFLKLKHDDNMPKPKKITDLIYPFNQTIISKTIRSGYLQKKSKLLKTYTKGFYILTLNYLHEFKSGDLVKHGLNPINSIKLDNCILVDSSENKFQLKVKEHPLGKSSISQNYVFKKIDLSETEFKRWIIDLKSLTSFDSFQERFEFLNNKLSIKNNSNNSLSATSSNSGQFISRTQTPHLDISNPMDDLSLINSKLENLQSNFDHNVDLRTDKTLSEPSFSMPQQAWISNEKYYGTNNSSGSSLKLNIPPPPTLSIQEPTPVRIDAPRLPELYREEEEPQQEQQQQQQQQQQERAEQREETPPVRPPLERTNTPMIGGYSSLTKENEELIKKIQLNQSLYRDSNNDVDLDKLMNSIH